MHQNCPICFEFLFESVDPTTVLRCGHTIHTQCVRVSAHGSPGQASHDHKLCDQPSAEHSTHSRGVAGARVPRRPHPALPIGVPAAACLLPPKPSARGAPCALAYMHGLTGCALPATHSHPLGQPLVTPQPYARPPALWPGPQELEANPNAVCPTCPICKKSLGDYSRHWAELDRQVGHRGPQGLPCASPRRAATPAGRHPGQRWPAATAAP